VLHVLSGENSSTCGLGHYSLPPSERAQSVSGGPSDFKIAVPLESGLQHSFSLRARWLILNS